MPSSETKENASATIEIEAHVIVEAGRRRDEPVKHQFRQQCLPFGILVHRQQRFGHASAQLGVHAGSVDQWRKSECLRPLDNLGLGGEFRLSSAQVFPYIRIDRSTVGDPLRDSLDSLGVAVGEEGVAEKTVGIASEITENLPRHDIAGIRVGVGISEYATFEITARA